MQVRIASGSTGLPVRALASLLTTTLIAAAVGSAAFAQSQPKGAPGKPPAAATKGGAAAQQKPAGETAPAPSAEAAQPSQPPLIFSPWTKFCVKGQEANAQQVCVTGKDGRIDSGVLAVAAALIEPEAPDSKKILRVTLPLGMLLPQGTRLIVDQGQPLNAPYIFCFANGCVADYEASAELVGKLKKGQGLVVQGVNSQGQLFSLGLPLTDFAKAYDGPPTDPKTFEEQQKKLQDDLQKRAEEARKKLEGQQPATR
ncbi:MAG TPA: invasion associated locus B family protein [Xanthobacteraceae bacterium]|nr:invasion associated locus B family protein [Xanthobacteraceae bacterium]